ncbi:SPOR domain-containing protein [Variovorax dokdonensis]|uniref:SPOR domain-containing protein n=1 Tax=Variovorax dokdonensis TaxID=344883 RepID=A0ABT7N7H1_9BURK|nr:SPOR domain-containing protein [Variovorax dokdonensis]MDM0043862.1 SPOR domain-containing protein [Variovorax dokdonensis]
MAFFKFRSSGQKTNEKRNAPSGAPAESVETMRRRARHRLLGAAVLVLLGVVGFPLLFDSQPRPLSGDVRIEIPDRNKTRPLASASAPAAATGKVGEGRGSSGEMITEAADGTEINVAEAPATAKPPEPKPDAKSEAKSEPKPEVKAEAKPEPKPEPKHEDKDNKAASKKPAGDDGTRALALLQGKKPADIPSGTSVAPAEDTSRFVVQVGAFADASKAQEVRQRLEKAGLKTYTNVAKTPQGDRTRVRVGPFASRADADKAADKVKGLSLPAAVLTL